MLHFPILRAGQPYKSLSVLDVTNFKTGEKIAELSQANSGLIRKDFSQAEKNKQTLNDLPVHELLTMCNNAATLFMKEELQKRTKEFAHRCEFRKGIYLLLKRRLQSLSI